METLTHTTNNEENHMSLQTKPCYLLIAKKPEDVETSLLIFEGIEDAQTQAQALVASEKYSLDDLKLMQTVIHLQSETASLPETVTEA